MKTKGLLFTLIAVIAVCGLSGIASADPYYINYSDTNTDHYGNDTLISSYALAPGSLIETFDSVTTSLPSTDISGVTGLDQASWTWGDGAVGSENGRVVQGSLTGAYAAPWSHVTGDQDASPYAAIPENKLDNPPRQVGVDFGADYRYLGLHWGSMDSFDGNWAQKIELYNDSALVATIVSPNPGDGSWTDADTNQYVNIFLTGDLVFDSAVFQSNEFAFEFDNLAVGTVPVPGAVLLGILGLSAAGIKLRKFA